MGHVDVFSNTSDPDTRITSLAGLFDLPGFGDQAQQLFYAELTTPEERLALFYLADPQAVGPQLITVVQNLYTDLKNNERDNTLLQAMLQQLEKIEDPRSVNLRAGIKQWLVGRNLYAQGQYQQAVTTYDFALSLNDRHPGIYFDRGEAYAALNELDQALADFETVLSLDPSRQPQVERAIMGKPLLYDRAIAQGATNPVVAATASQRLKPDAKMTVALKNMKARNA